MDAGLSWPEVEVIGAIIASVAAGAWAVYRSIKAQFDMQSAEFRSSFELQRAEGEHRTIRTHDKIDSLREEVHKTFMPRREAELALNAFSQALAERDAQFNELAHRVGERRGDH